MFSLSDPGICHQSINHSSSYLAADIRRLSDMLSRLPTTSAVITDPSAGCPPGAVFNSAGERITFATAGARLWNSSTVCHQTLSRVAPSLFPRELKTFFYLGTLIPIFCFSVRMDPVNTCVKFEVCSFTRSWDNRGYSKYLGSPWIRPRSLFSKIFHGLVFGWTLWIYRPNLQSIALAVTEIIAISVLG